MNKKIFYNVFRSFLTLICILSLTLPAWAAVSGPGSDIGVTVVTTAKATATAPESEDGKNADPAPDVKADTAAKAESGEAKDGRSRVITCGTGESDAAARKPDAAARQPEAEPEEAGTKGTSLGMFTTTGYCNCSQCSGGHNLTYSGTVPKARHTLSADLSIYPIGTKLMIGDTIYTVEDMGSSVKGNWLDIYYDNHDAAVAHGMKTQEVFTVVP